MRRRIHHQRVRAKASWRVFQNSISVGRVLLNDGHSADGIRRVGMMQTCFVRGAVGSEADRQHRDERSRVSMEDNEFAVTGALDAIFPAGPGLQP